jgi:hypothetical protein
MWGRLGKQATSLKNYRLEINGCPLYESGEFTFTQQLEYSITICVSPLSYDVSFTPALHCGQ